MFPIYSFTYVIIRLGTCMNYTNPATNQQKSWIYTDTTYTGDASQFLLYYQFFNTLDCVADSTGSNVIPTQVGCAHPSPSL